jgi:anti-anti-sigma factor
MEIITRKDQKATVVAPRGRLDAVSSPDFESALGHLVTAGEKWFVLDLSKVDYISSAGLRAVMMVAKKARASGGEAVLVGLKGSVAEVVDLAGLQSLLRVFANECEALTSL